MTVDVLDESGAAVDVHRLVSDIVDAYGRHDTKRAATASREAARKGGRRPGERR